MYALIPATIQTPAFQVNRKNHISIRLLMEMVRRICLHLGSDWLMDLKKSMKKYSQMGLPKYSLMGLPKYSLMGLPKSMLKYWPKSLLIDF